MSDNQIIIAFLIVVFFIWAIRYGGRLPKPYAQRDREGKGWWREFPSSSKTEIREYLQTFVDAFAFDESEKLKLSPNDRILDIYKSLYSRAWMADCLEVETFLDDLEAKYGIDLASTWHKEITLGDVFGEIASGSAVPNGR